MENKELNLNEMEEAAGGKGGSKKVLPKKEGFVVYQIATGDTLIRIAKKYGIADYRTIISWNPHINKQTNMIRTGEWLWIKK